MICLIEGTVVGVEPTSRTVGSKGLLVSVDTGAGIGYEVITNVELSEGEWAQFCIHQVIREDDSKLYGFSGPARFQERNAFRSMLKIKGIGPVAALSVLRGGMDLFSAAITAKDVDYFTSKSGIGEKTARLIIAARGWWK